MRSQKIEVVPGVVVNLDVDKEFRRLREMPIAETVHELADEPFVWCRIMPYLKNTDEEKANFWREFDVPKAATARLKAALGNAPAARQDAIELIDTIRANLITMSGAIAAHKEGNDSESLADTAFYGSLADEIGQTITNRYSTGDISFFKHLAEIVKDQDRMKRSKKGGLPSQSGSVWGIFVSLLLENEKLPTKDDILLHPLLKNRDINSSRAFGEIGLNGLRNN